MLTDVDKYTYAYRDRQVKKRLQTHECVHIITLYHVSDTSSPFRQNSIGIPSINMSSQEHSRQKG